MGSLPPPWDTLTKITRAHAESTSVGPGPHAEEMARHCLSRELQHIQWAGSLSPGRHNSHLDEVGGIETDDGIGDPFIFSDQ
jgi:hypothetical protein